MDKNQGSPPLCQAEDLRRAGDTRGSWFLVSGVNPPQDRGSIGYSSVCSISCLIIIGYRTVILPVGYLSFFRMRLVGDRGSQLAGSSPIRLSTCSEVLDTCRSYSIREQCQSSEEIEGISAPMFLAHRQEDLSSFRSRF